MKVLLFVTLLIFLLACSKDEPPKELPNIVIILADDLGYGDPTCYNPESKIPTPNIDNLASEGMMFTDAHSPSSVCTPTRYGILTGRYAWRTRLKNGVLWPWDKPLIDEERLTLPEMLKEKGYHTAAIGKWHLGWLWPASDTLSVKGQNGTNIDYTKSIEGGPLAHGFDYYFGDDVPNFPPYTFIENNKVVAIPDVEKPDSLFGHKGMMQDGWNLRSVMPAITKKSVDYITKASKKNEPFFLYFALTAPHTPIAPTSDFIGKSEAGLYGDFVNEADWSVGQILNALKENGLDKNTLVIFTSDNGSPARNGKNWSGPTLSVVSDFGHNPSAHFRGMKSDAWEGGHRVPFIIKWDDKITKTTSNPALISSLDIMPTLAEIVNYQLPANVAEDGISMSKTFFGEDREGRERLVHHSGNGVFVIRKGDWKLIFSDGPGGFSNYLYPDGIEDGNAGQLYNLKDDPSEKNNLYKEFPEIVEELTTDLEKIKKGNSYQ